MNRYLVRITATSQKFVHVEADNMKNARKEAYTRWKNSDPQFIFTADDHVDVKLYVYDNEE